MTKLVSDLRYVKWALTNVSWKREREKESSTRSLIEKRYLLSGTSSSLWPPGQTRFSHSRFLISETHSIRRLRAQNALVAQGFLKRLAPGRCENYRQNVNMHYVAVSPSTRIWYRPPGHPREIQRASRVLSTICNFAARFLSFPFSTSLSLLFD